MKQELKLGPPSITVEYPHNLDGRKPYRPNFVQLLQDIQYKNTVNSKEASKRFSMWQDVQYKNTIRFYILLGGLVVNAVLQYWF